MAHKRITYLPKSQSLQLIDNDYLLISQKNGEKYDSKNAKMSILCTLIKEETINKNTLNINYELSSIDSINHTVPLSNLILSKNTAYQQGTTDSYGFYFPKPYQTIMVCEDEDEVQQCKDKFEFNFEKVFNNWTQFAHWKNEQGGITPNYPVDTANIRTGYNKWYLDSTNNTIVQPMNTTDFCGYVSTEKFQTYSFTTRCYSTYKNDDDMIGLVAAFTTDDNGKQHTLSFIRTPNNTNTDTDAGDYHWYVIIDANRESSVFSPTKEYYGSKCLKNGTLNKNNENSGYWGSNNVKWGTLINIERNGNVFKGKTTTFSDSEKTKDDLGYELKVDLGEYINDPNYSKYKNVLTLFTKPCSVGFCTTSQNYSMYDVYEIPLDGGIIADLANKRMYQYNLKTKEWDTINTTPELYLDKLKPYYNKITKKCWMRDDSVIYLIYGEKKEEFYLIDDKDNLIIDDKIIK